MSLKHYGTIQEAPMINVLFDSFSQVYPHNQQ